MNKVNNEERIKKSLFMEECTSQEELLKCIKENNFNNRFLIIDMLMALYYMPKELKVEFEQLCELYASKNAYCDKLKYIKTLLEEDVKFMGYSIFINNVFLHGFSDNKKICKIDNKKITDYKKKRMKALNCLTYDIAADYINEYVLIDKFNFILNLHFLIKWKNDNFNNETVDLSVDECRFLSEIIYDNINCSKINLSSLKSLEKFCLKNLTQIMLFVFLKLIDAAENDFLEQIL